MKHVRKVDERRHPQCPAEMENLLRETFSYHKAGRHLASSQLPLSSDDLLAVPPPNFLIIIFPVIPSSPKQETTTKREGRNGRRDGGRHL